MLEPERRRPDIGRTDRPKINTAYFNARKFLEHKLDEILATTQIPALGAVLVRDEGRMIISAARGKRKIGAVGEGNNVKPTDRWCLASVSKPITGTAIAAMIDRDVGGIGWTTTLDDVFPEIFDDQQGDHSAYKNATIELMMAHSAGFGYNPEGEPDNIWVEEETPAYLNDDKVRERRYLFTRAYVLDPPLYPPGQPGEYEGDPDDRYSGGPIVCAALYENKTARRFEHLLRDHLYTPLGMNDSGWGRTNTGPYGGLWLHRWDSENARLEVDPEPHKEAQDYHSHMPAGGYGVSMEDFGKFLAEFIVDEPKVLSEETRNYVLTNNPASGQNYLSSGWGRSGAGAVRHRGQLGFCYTSATLDFQDRWGVAVFANASALVSKPAVSDALNALATLRDDWDMIAGADSALRTYHPSVHPTPGIVPKTSGVTWVIGRKHDGSLRREKPATGQAGFWPGMVATSGVACASSADGDTIHVAVRGSDNNLWNSRSRDGGATWTEFAALPAKLCRSGPALACSSDGSWLYAAVTDTMGKIHFAASPDRGQTWSQWFQVGGHVFTAQPGIACSSDGQIIHLVGRGFERGILHNSSRARGSDWGDGWEGRSGNHRFSAGPTVICDGDGDRVRIASRAADRRIFWTKLSDESGNAGIWREVDSDFKATSSPVFARKGQALVLAAYGDDHYPHRTVGTLDGDWGDWQQVGVTKYI